MSSFGAKRLSVDANVRGFEIVSGSIAKIFERRWATRGRS